MLKLVIFFGCLAISESSLARLPPRPDLRLCPDFQCAISCEHGLKQNVLGCEICECLDAPTVVDVCKLSKQVGNCDGDFNKWYHNSASGQCEGFSYGGCGGNSNKFDSKSDCEKQCPPTSTGPCLQPSKVKGKCRNRIIRYSFNKSTSKCERFYYSGCLGNGNNFESLSACKKSCLNPNPPQITQKPTPSGVCNLPSKTGYCRAYFPRWYFNKDSGKCETFVYGGCNSNGNNFRTKDECERKCPAGTPSTTTHRPTTIRPPVCGPVCLIDCKYGNVKDRYGCPTCSCNPGPAVKSGVCPRPSGLVGICVFTERNCLSDYECPGQQKCCSEGCGRVCKSPVRNCHDSCYHNSDCRFGKRCVTRYNGCKTCQRDFPYILS